MNLDKNFIPFLISFAAAMVGVVAAYLRKTKPGYKVLFANIMWGAAVAFFIAPYLAELAGLKSQTAQNFYVFALSFFGEQAINLVYSLSIGKFTKQTENGSNN